MPKHSKKPIIGVTGPDKGGAVLRWFTKLAVRLGGGQPRALVPSNPHDLAHFDGFVIAGGGDINPERYGEAALLAHKQYDSDRDALEARVVKHAVETGKPLLGICRGMQLLNVARGGSLYQEAKDVLEDFLPSKSLFSKIIGRRNVNIDAGSRLFTVLGGYKHYRVNSIHHQAVNALGDELIVVGREENQLIQAVEQAPDSTHPFLIGVQWHPELMLHAASARRLFKALVQAARRR